MNTKSRLKVAIALALSLAATAPLESALAANNDGALAGKLSAPDRKAIEGVEITVRNPETGFSRTTKPDAQGNYRFPYLPVGKYELEATREGAEIGKLGEVTVNVGNTTIANVEVAGTTIDTVEVVSTRVINKVDVTTTESATNISIDELDRLPVARDITSVALLAPGLNKGDEDLSSPGVTTLSFGGSSVAENTVYVNGLNVTDFYNRVGASSVPFAFYKDFQFKTGGYSTEFGRTTGGVINAVTKSGTNTFDFGAEIVWEPHDLQSEADDQRYPDGSPRIVARNDFYDRTTANFYASGPIVQDKLFFFALYEARKYEPQNTNDSGSLLFKSQSDDAFWGAKLDWQISDGHLLELLAFSDDNEEVEDTFDFDEATDTEGAYQNTQFENTGGENWALTYSAYFTDNFVMKALYGENQRQFARFSNNDLDCNRTRDLRTTIGQGDVGCTTTASRTLRDDTRDAARLDFEWTLGDHQLRFGMDHETNTSVHTQFYPGEDRLLYEVRTVAPGSTLENGGVVPAGVTAYVRTRRNEVDGEFESINQAFYLEDNWSITPNFILNAGLRLEAFDNRNGEGDTYIKIDDMLAPRFGFSWDIKGDSRLKLFGNAGRYFLPVANVINIKQAGGFLDERTYYAFSGFEDFEYQGQTYQRALLGAQIGGVNNSQGDGTVGDLRGEVDQDIDAVYQDELILGFQQMITDTWSWGVRGIYRKLNNAIDDMEITSTGTLCGGEPTGAGFVMGNPGEDLTIFTDTDCDGENDALVTIDTSQAGWALLDDNGDYVGEAGFPEPRRTYKAVELVLDRAWDKTWSLNASYTLSYSEGNAEGPVNSDTNFADSGRTEAFDDPWVNYNGFGYLPNDHRHQFKLRGAYALNDNWQFGATLSVLSGRPISAFGVGNPFDGTNYRSNFICVERCGLNPETPDPDDAYPPSQRVYVEGGRGEGGRTPWIYDIGASVTYTRSFGLADMEVKLAVYNLLNQQRALEADDDLETDIGSINDEWATENAFQSPRYAYLTLKFDF